MRRNKAKQAIALLAAAIILFSSGCSVISATSQVKKEVPRANKWGIYKLDIGTRDTTLIYSYPYEIFSSALRLSEDGKTLVFAQKTGGQTDNHTEIFSINVDDHTLKRLTNNNFFDLYPAWSPGGGSPDDGRIAFLSWREKDLDIYMMDADGDNVHKFYDSGDHDADIDWAGDNIVFTAQFAIWRISESGGQAVQITNPPDRGKWGKANLPAGDYDPRLSPDGKRVIFERLENTGDIHGGYNFFTINTDGTNETRLTSNYYAQGLASWSNSGKSLVYTIAAINGEGKYDIYMMNADGGDNHNITPDYFPPDFLCYTSVFSEDDTAIYFIGQWWEN